MVKKAAERSLIKFFLVVIGQSIPPLFSYKFSDGIKPLWDETAFPDLTIFFRYLLIMSIASLFTVFMTLKVCLKIFPKRSHKIFSIFAIIEATIKGRYKLLSAISEKNSRYREIYKGKGKRTTNLHLRLTGIIS